MYILKPKYVLTEFHYIEIYTYKSTKLVKKFVHTKAEVRTYRVVRYNQNILYYSIVNLINSVVPYFPSSLLSISQIQLQTVQ